MNDFKSSSKFDCLEFARIHSTSFVSLGDGPFQTCLVKIFSTLWVRCFMTIQSTQCIFCKWSYIFSCRLAGKLWSSILLLSLSLDNVYPLANYVCEWHNFLINHTCLILFKLFQTCFAQSNMFKLFSNLFQPIQTCLNFLWVL